METAENMDVGKTRAANFGRVLLFIQAPAKLSVGWEI